MPKSVCFLVNQRAVRSTADFVRGIVAGSAARRKNRAHIHGFNVNLFRRKNTYEKSTKLLSVILAVVMIFSTMSVMAFAAKTEYQTSDNLTALDAYSPDGAVTRLSTEERMSVVFDFLDVTLAAANINMGEVINTAGLRLVIDLRSVNALCGTIDSAQALLNNGLVKLVKGLLGIVKDANLKNWKSGMTREKNAQLDIVNGIATLLNDNAGLVKKVINDGKLDVGIIGNFVDISGVNKYLSDLPGMLKGLVYPVFARVDDDMTLINTYSTTTEIPTLLSRMSSSTLCLSRRAILLIKKTLPATA